MSWKEQKVCARWRVRQSKTMKGSCQANFAWCMQLSTTNAPLMRTMTILAEITITVHHAGQGASISTAAHRKAAMIHHLRRSLA